MVDSGGSAQVNPPRRRARGRMETVSRTGCVSATACVALMVLALALPSAGQETTAPAPDATPAPPAAPAGPPSACPVGTPETCNCLLECCRPGATQLGDGSDEEATVSFCTNKPFQTDYKMRMFEKVPVQINLRDYCTDEILFTSYIAPRVDRFTLVEFPCTYRASDCSMIADAVQQQECEKGFDVYTKQLNCTGNTSFFKQVIESRICNEQNVQKKALKGAYFWEPGLEGTPAMPATVGVCNCNFTAAIKRSIGKTVKGKVYTDNDLRNVTVGVPNGFIKDGMSTFYIEVVIGGRSTAERGSDKECMCKGACVIARARSLECTPPRAPPPHLRACTHTGVTDDSDACMCELGSKKVPYVYNNSFVPQLTTLISMQKGQMFYTNTFVQVCPRAFFFSLLF